VNLDTAPIGAVVVVRAVTGPGGFRRRLLELGLLPGVSVKKRKVAPLGDPIELEVRGARLSIRRAEARGIEVEG
jgi:Fe2+ transport system protein FeoA